MSDAPEAPRSQLPDDAEHEPAPDAVAVHNLVRLHNLMILIVFLAGLICTVILAILRKRGGGSGGSPELMRILVAVRIAAPIAALIATGVYTNLVIGAFVRRSEARPLNPLDLLPLFRRCKLLSIVLLTLAGLHADVCLILGNRVIDLLLAIATFILLIMTRPSLEGFESFAVMVGTQREELPGSVPTSDSE